MQLFENSIRTIVGVLLLFLGIVGLFVPVLQGILLIFLGLLFLSGQRLKGWWVKWKQLK
jgi:uncharacterized protein YqgC (DUF456 family)